LESSLAIEMKELKARTGSFLGWGMGADYDDVAYSAESEFELDGILKSALARVYWPHLIDQVMAHSWSWLTPTASLTLEDGETTVDLPFDFNGLEGPIWATPSDGVVYLQLFTTNAAKIDGMYSMYPDSTGSPEMVAVRPVKGTGHSKGQRWDLYFWPEANEDYTLTLAYHICPEALTPANPFCYGGPSLREVFLESCLALAEERLDDNQGVHAAAFQRLLQGAISHDRKKRPQVLGKNLDRSSDLVTRDRRRDALVTFDGTLWD
jgi:hypothetical protein